MNDPINASAAERVPKLPDQLKPFLTLLDEPLGLPVCRGCQAASLPKSLMDHLRKHHQLPVELKKTVESLVATLPSLDFDDVPSRLDGSDAMEALRVVDAFQCQHCAFIRRDVTDVRKHINKEHNISAAGGYGQIRAQSWFRGRRAVYWRVRVVPAVNLEGGQCRWGFFGGGFGHRRPQTALEWEKVMQPEA